MSKGDDVANSIDKIFAEPWSIRDGRVVPKTDDVALSNGAVRLEATFLYADLYDSTTIATKLSTESAARLLRAYLSSMTTLIKYQGGEVRSFDGDRVMGVFVGDSKNSSAAKCALQMNYVVSKVLRPKALAKFSSVSKRGLQLSHCAGIDTGDVLVVRAGVRDSNDLVFVGSAPNFAAKLSDVRMKPYHSYISPAVYGRLSKQAKYGANDKAMWELRTRKFGGVTKTVYRSKFRWNI